MSDSINNENLTRQTVMAILTCYNRCDMTIRCIKKLAGGNKNIALSFVVVDDGSTDNTKEGIDSLINEGYDIRYLSGNGNLYWAGGMRLGIGYALNNTNYDYYLLVNDDVDFVEKTVENMICDIEAYEGKCSALAGATCGSNGKLTYGGIKYTGKGIQYETKDIDYREKCDTFNTNCVLIPRDIFIRAGNFDEKYIQSLADFDYGLRISREIGDVYVHNKYVGICENNTVKNTWKDTSLSRLTRLKLKEDPKGAPFKQWFYFLHKNFGLFNAVLHGFTPYFRILLGK